MSQRQDNYTILFLVTCTILGQGCATIPSPREGRGELPLAHLCEQEDIHWQWDSLLHMLTLRFDQEEARFFPGSNAVAIQDEIIYLTKPSRIEGSRIFVPADFQKKIIARLKKSKGSTIFPMWKIKEIIIDAGHGGKDPGAIGVTGLQEKDVVLDIAKRLKRLLEEEGIKVIMTREKDEFISLQGRTEMASRFKSDFFVSLHANASPVESVQGIEVFSITELGETDKNEIQRRTNHQIHFNQLLMQKDDRCLGGIISDLLYAHKRNESRVLAALVAQQTAHFVQTQNRGPKLARYYVLRNTLIPAILVEIGFLSNPQEEALLADSSYRQKLAMGLAKSILEYANP